MKDAKIRTNVIVLIALQMNYCEGFMEIGLNLTDLTRSLLVASTLGDEMRARYERTAKTSKIRICGRSNRNQEPRAILFGGAPDVGRSSQQGAWGVADHPRIRYWVRRVCCLSKILFFLIAVLSTGAGCVYVFSVESSVYGVLVRSIW